MVEVFSSEERRHPEEELTVQPQVEENQMAGLDHYRIYLCFFHVVTIGDLVITKEFGGLVEDRSGVTRSGLRYRPPLPSTTISAEDQGVAHLESSELIPFHVTTQLVWDMDGIYMAMKGLRRYYGAVGTIELDDFIQEFDTWCDMQFLRNPTLFTFFFAWKRLFKLES
ncbi:hypothetical protein AXG93_606s1310 [Marchantia polymorpha subsp. ruderalis]|uniref:Uncharacterized protein n=1 Tax=Marchantia polymorpha subsp. ruderalis TaxID=1480154 RepID=A0A176VM97_MARPO|nr:hypothetical protein AXG93_606s1310 [Marchantia polymorpha subsp. ruderalis]